MRTDEWLSVLGRVVDRARADEGVEAFGLDETETTVKAHDGAVESLSSARRRGVGIRVVSDRRVGYCYTVDLSDDALAAALRLSVEDHVHLRGLAKANDTGLCLAARPPDRSVRPSLRALLDQLEPGPAALLNRVNDVIAHTSGYERLVGPLGALDGQPPNLVRFLFTDPRARTAFPDWERVADQQVAELKGVFGPADPYITALADELTSAVGAPFADRWAAPTTPHRRTQVERLTHPDVGALRLTSETLGASEADDQRLLVYLPADEHTSQALDRLARRQPGALRAV